MAVITIKIGTDQQVIAVETVVPSIGAEVRSATSSQDYLSVIERRIPTPFPTVEIGRSVAIDAIAKTPHLTDAQKAEYTAAVQGLGEFDKLVFLGPYAPPTGNANVQRTVVTDGQPAVKKPLVIVFIDP